MPQHSEIWSALIAPFGRQEEKQRDQSGRVYTYITARTVMNRLDMVVGPENWWDEYTPIENAVICKLTLRLPDGSTLTKADAGGFTATADSSDYEKTGFSDAFKRAAVKFGVGRYLYRDGVPCYESARPKSAGEGRSGSATTAALAVVPPPEEDRSAPAASGREQAPRTGKALWAWANEHDCLDRVQAIGRSFGHPDRIVQWDGDQVAAVVREVTVKPRARSRQYQEA